MWTEERRTCNPVASFVALEVNCWSIADGLDSGFFNTRNPAGSGLPSEVVKFHAFSYAFPSLCLALRFLASVSIHGWIIFAKSLCAPFRATSNDSMSDDVTTFIAIMVPSSRVRSIPWQAEAEAPKGLILLSLFAWSCESRIVAIAIASACTNKVRGNPSRYSSE